MAVSGDSRLANHEVSSQDRLAPVHLPHGDRWMTGNQEGGLSSTESFSKGQMPMSPTTTSLHIPKSQKRTQRLGHGNLHSQQRGRGELTALPPSLACPQALRRGRFHSQNTHTPEKLSERGDPTLERPGGKEGPPSSSRLSSLPLPAAFA